jgi:hypothetical protein
MTEWDSFCMFHFCCLPCNDLKDIELMSPAERDYQRALYEQRMIVFKDKTKAAYARFRETLQVLDAAMLDHNVLQMTPRLASSGLLYLMLNKFFYTSDYALVLYTGEPNYPSASLSLAFGSPAYDNVSASRVEEGSAKVKELVCNFLSLAAEVSDPGQLELAVNFFEGFVPMSLEFSLPLVTRCMTAEALEQQVYEEFLSYQTYNPLSREFVCRR